MLLHQFNPSDDSFETFEHLTKEKNNQAQKKITILTFYEFYILTLACKITTPPKKQTNKQTHSSDVSQSDQHDSYWPVILDQGCRKIFITGILTDFTNLELRRVLG